MFDHRNKILKSFPFRLLHLIVFLGFFQLHSAIAEETSPTVKIAKKLAVLWDTFHPPYDENTTRCLAGLRAELEKPTALLPHTITILKAISLERGWNPQFQIPDNPDAAALGVIYRLQPVLTQKQDSTGITLIQRDGRVAKFLEYGYSQIYYDRGLSGVYYYNLPRTEQKRRWLMPMDAGAFSAPNLSEYKLQPLQKLFAKVGDKQWEIKTLKWCLGMLGSQLISSDAAPLWVRLSQLENDTSKELDQILALASGVKEADLHEKTQGDIKNQYTKEQYQWIVQTMLDLKMPWEAYLFLQDHKKANEVDPHLTTLIQEAWQHDFVQTAKDIERQRSKQLNVLPWYVVGVQITPDITLEEFIRQIKLRPNLPK
jgi:hypothetical protein